MEYAKNAPTVQELEKKYCNVGPQHVLGRNMEKLSLNYPCLVCIPILVTTFPEWLSGTEPFRALDLRNLVPKFGPIPKAKKYAFFPILDEKFPI